MNRLIRNSAKALIIKDGRMLAVRINDGGDVFYIMPGGGQEPGESLASAARREVKEELGITIEVRDIAFIIEGMRGESFHRVDIVFLCDYISHDASPTRADTNQAGWDWLDISTLNKAPLYPSKLRRQIMNLCSGKPRDIYLGDESMGDPEYTD